MKLEPVIGLEIHVQLKTQSKMFCDCKNGVETPPSAAICPVCMGHPGTLPVPNKTALDVAIKTILALDGTVNEHSKFDRKHYFYPDLPKGYQISQYDQPIGSGGHLDITVNGKERRIHLTRIHVEEDAAKLLHDVTPSNSPLNKEEKMTFVDYNRAGTPLIEIVTEPDFRSPHEAKIFLQELRLLLRTLGISDADMEKGQLRCDANISLRQKADNAERADTAERLNAKTEIKNMNSFRAVERALEYEIIRQTKLWNEDKRPAAHATRGWDDTKHVTVEQRTKEEAHDYRYFPEPDIPPLHFTQKAIQTIRRTIPELPSSKLKRFEGEYSMDVADARILIEDPALANWTEHVLSELRAWLIALEGPSTLRGDSVEPSSGFTAEEKWDADKRQLVKLTIGWITSKLFALINETHTSSDALPITAENFAEFIALLYERKINSTTAQDVLRAMFETGIDPSTFIDERELAQVQDTGAIDTVVTKIIAEHPDVITTYKGGKEGALQYLVGQVMKDMKGKADPVLVQKILKKELNS